MRVLRIVVLLSNPTSLAFLPDSRMLVTLKGGDRFTAKDAPAPGSCPP